MNDPATQLEGFIAKFSEEVAAQARAILARMGHLVPGAISLVYDNYNALAIGYGATDKQAGLVFSIAVYPRWVSLFFTQGASLNDPKGLLKGEGRRIRHIVLCGPGSFDDPDVRTLMTQALARAEPTIDASRPNQLIIQSVSPKQKSRRSA